MQALTDQAHAAHRAAGIATTTAPVSLPLVAGVDKEAITARLTQDQAFMLSDWLYQVRFQSDDLEGIMHNRAVWSPIYAIPGTLDKTLSEVFMPDYGLRLEAAKERLRADLYGGAGESTAPGQSTTDAPQAHQIERGTAGNHRERSQARRSHPSAVRSGQQPNGLE